MRLNYGEIIWVKLLDNYELRITNYELRITNYELRIGSWGIFKIIIHPLEKFVLGLNLIRGILRIVFYHFL